MEPVLGQKVQWMSAEILNGCPLKRTRGISMKIRKAQKEDLPELLTIYNYEVENGVATFDTTPATEEQRRDWLQNHNIENHPLYVAELDGKAVGYVSLSSFNDKEAYSGTVELSLYIGPEYRGRGIGRDLMKFIIELAERENGIHTIVSLITSENKASIQLHQEYGFQYCGTIKEAGYKFGRYLDVDYYQLIL